MLYLLRHGSFFLGRGCTGQQTCRHEGQSHAECIQDPDDHVAIGPPVPQDEGDELVGPAVPPEEPDGEDGDAWDGRGLGEPDEQEDPYRLPVTSEVALEGKLCGNSELCP